MRFLLYETGHAQPSAPPSQQMMEEVGKFTEETKRAGILLATGGLAPLGTRVRSSGGKLAVTDGPFTETKEQLGGLYVIECAGEAEALEWARKLPASPGLVVEVRANPEI